MRPYSQGLRKRILDSVSRGEGSFETYVEQALVPQQHPGDLVIWDNLTPHKAKSVVKAINRAGAKVPHCRPQARTTRRSRRCFSKVKGALKSAARTTDAVTTAIGCTLRDVTPQDIVGWFKSRATYTMQS